LRGFAEDFALARALLWPSVPMFTTTTLLRAGRWLALLPIFAAPRALAADPAAEAVAAAAPDAPDGTGSVNGLYPLWEGTAAVHRAGAVEIGYQHAQIGFDVGLGRMQLGTQPIMDLHGAFNADAKVQLWRGPQLLVGLGIGSYRLTTGAEA
jgi:hypothetical protein